MPISLASQITRNARVRGAELVAIGIAQIGDIEFDARAFADARRFLTGFSAMGETSRVERIGRLDRTGGETDRAAVGVRRYLAVDRLCHRKSTGLGPVENAVAVDPSG